MPYKRYGRRYEEITPFEASVLHTLAARQAARKSFWYYCQLVDPDFYKPHRTHLKTLCNTLDDLYRGRLTNPETGDVYKKLAISIPPQHGKSRTLVNFCNWVLGLNNEERIITASYNDTTAGDFSRYVRDAILRAKINDDVFVFSDIFPETKIKQGNSSVNRWALEGQHFNYLGAGLGGSITSKGASILIIDDPIKNAEEAFNDNRLESIWQWYTGTFLSRVSAETQEPIEIIVMTRWSSGDLIGRILKNDDERDNWYILKMEAYNAETDEMLCPEFLTKKRYFQLSKIMDRAIFRANYHQEPIERKGALYSGFKTYTETPKDENGQSLFEGVKSYCDSADTGDDYLCNIIYGEYQGVFYVLDVYYTQEAMEITEPETARRLARHNIDFALFESNNGGRGFSRNVAREYQNITGRRLVFKWFYQSKNKVARILANSARVQQTVLFPVDWANRWPRFYDDLMSYKKTGKNKHDDAPDALTGVVETEELMPKARAVARI